MDVDTRAAGKASIARVRSLRGHIRASSTGRIIWRAGITLAGVGIIVVGIVLLPLPGPGWLIIFAGLGLLATEYEWAARLLRYARRTLARWAVWVSSRHWMVQAVIAVAGLLLIAGLGAAAWLYYGS